MIAVGKLESAPPTLVVHKEWVIPEFLGGLPGSTFETFPAFLSWMRVTTGIEEIAEIEVSGIQPIPDVDPAEPGMPAVEFWLKYMEKGTTPPHAVISLFLAAEDSPNMAECENIRQNYA